jgi:hypothetical protein
MPKSDYTGYGSLRSQGRRVDGLFIRWTSQGKVALPCRLAREPPV